MPKVRCYVKKCRNQSVFRFPKKLRLEWLKAIGRSEDDPGPHNGLCGEHFTPDDFLTESYHTGVILTRKRLKSAAIPTRLLPPPSRSVGESQPTPKRPRNVLNKSQDSPKPAAGDLGGSKSQSDEFILGVFVMPPEEPSVEVSTLLSLGQPYFRDPLSTEEDHFATVNVQDSIVVDVKPDIIIDDLVQEVD